jgi:hypothetical protein
MNSDLTQTSSIANLLRELRDEATTLLRQQVSLAKAELQENASRMAGHAAQIAVGGLVAFVGSIVALVGLSYLVALLLERAGLEEDNARWLGFVLVGALVSIAGAVLLARAKKALANDPLTPRKTIETLKTDQQWAQEKTATLS